MKDWPFGVALRGRLQTASCCSTFFLGLPQPSVGLWHPGEPSVAFMLLPFVASNAWPLGSPRRLGRRLGSASKSLCRAKLARSSVIRKARTNDWSTMSRIWAGTDCGKTHHHTLVLDAEGDTLLSRRVANDESELLELIADVLEIADGDRATWALDMTGGELGLLIELLVNHGQELVYIPGIAVNRATDSYRGQGKTQYREV